MTPQHGERHRSGACVFLTGLPASGKTTVARALQATLETQCGRTTTLLDGDDVRRLFSPELGFSDEERALHVRRMASIAAEVVRHGGICICAAIAPLAEHRRLARQLVQAHGAFVLVHVATPLAVCAARDPKGLYAAAHAGRMSGLTGVQSPYEDPVDADVVLDTSQGSIATSARRLIEFLGEVGLVRAPAQVAVPSGAGPVISLAGAMSANPRPTQSG